MQREPCVVRIPSRVASVLPALSLLILSTACLGQASHAQPAVATVTPATSSATEPIHIRVDHLPPSSTVDLELRSLEDGQVAWLAGAKFRSDKRGVVDVDKSPATSGSYTGVDGMGLVWSMSPADPAAAS